MTAAPPPAAEFVSPKAIARRYSVSPRTVRNWVSAGVFPAVKIGHVVRIRLADAIAALEVDFRRHPRSYPRTD